MELHMKQKINLLNIRFGRLLVIQESEKTSYNRTQWLCKCDCGNEVKVATTSLQSGATVSCGCFRIEQCSKKLSLDLIGKKFGKLLVLERKGSQKLNGENYKYARSVWLCLCDCGKTYEVTGQLLILNKVCSCGCASVISGEKHHNWNPNKTDEERLQHRDTKEYFKWRKSIFNKFNWTCQCCKVKRHLGLNAHHIQNYSNHKELRFNIDNGLLLCRYCHRKFHKEYGRKNNNISQLKEFLQNNEKETVLHKDAS
jgi:hypothetical protein